MENSILAGKTIIFDGDSICHAASEVYLPGSTNRGWAGRIGETYQMDWHNFGLGGATITAELYSSLGARHWVSRSIDTIHDEFPCLDYLILEGGTNDADLLVGELDRFGHFDTDDFSGNYDDTTFCGACETLFYKAVHYYPEAKLGFIIAPKMGAVTDCANNTAILERRRYFFETTLELCRKWHIPYLDLWEQSVLDPRYKEFYDETLGIDGNKQQHKAYMDGQHLTADGYDLVTPLIERWVLGL